MTDQNKCESGETSYVSSWLASKLHKKPPQPVKQTDEQRYYTALYNCGEASI